jgi:hypothetical protein
MMDFEYEFAVVGKLKAPLDVGAGPFGVRRYEVIGGSIEGKRIKGKALTGGGDWLLVGADGFARLDVRVQFLTEDGAAIYAYYPGLLELNQKVGQAIASGGQTDYGDQYFRVTPRFETGDQRYAWLNQTLFAAEGRLGAGMVEYKVYRF